LKYPYVKLDPSNGSDEGNRWSVFYDIAECPELFKGHLETFKQAAYMAREDSNEQVREQASKQGI